MRRLLINKEFGDKMISQDLYKKYNFDNKEERKNIENENAWKQEMFKVYGVIGNPKAEKAYDVAWEYGHDKPNFLRVVEVFFALFCEVIK